MKRAEVVEWGECGREGGRVTGKDGEKEGGIGKNRAQGAKQSTTQIRRSVLSDLVRVKR